MHLLFSSDTIFGIMCDSLFDNVIRDYLACADKPADQNINQIQSYCFFAIQHT